MLTMARSENAIGMAMNTPVGPKPNCVASSQPSGISQNQKQKKFSQVGVHVSPAPLNAEVMHMPAA